MTRMERRRYRRYELRHRALVVARGGNPVACEVANVCEGGMWLTEVESTSLVSSLRSVAGARVEVHLFCQDGGGEQHLRVLAEVRRAEGRDLGIEFVSPMPELMRTLLELRATGVSASDSPLPNQRRRELWLACQARSRDFLIDLMDQFQEQALDEVQRREEVAASFDESNRLRDARVLLVETREALAGDFLRQWQGRSEWLVQDRRKSGAVPGALQVVDKAQFEEWLELQMIATAAAGRQRPALFLLNQYLSQVAGRQIEERTNPLGPVVLCQTLQAVIDRRDLPDYLRPLLFHAFERSLDSLWDAFVQEMNRHFEARGLRAVPLDRMRVNWNEGDNRRSRQSGVQDSPRPSGTGAGSGAAESREGGRSGEGSVLSLMHLLRAPAGGAGGAIPQPGKRARRNVVTELVDHKPQIRQALRDGNETMHGVLDSLARELPAMDREEEAGLHDMADLVDQLFAPLDREPHLQPELLSLLRQLKLPLLQVLMTAPEFLERRDHPGRRVLNYFVDLCSADRASSRNLEKTLSDVVEQILQVDEPDPAFLKGIGDRLEVLVERQERAFQRNAERIAKTCEGHQRLEEARRAIHRRINALLAGNRVPLVLVDLLGAGWEQLMVVALLREGGESTHLAEMFSVLAQLNRWLGPEGEREDMAFERELETPVLLDEIERQLQATGEPARFKPVVQRLRLLLQEEAEPEFVWLASYPLSERSDDPGTGTAPAGRWSDRARALAVGDWVTRELEDGGKQRMKLVWVGQDAYKFVFLTSQGLHEVELGLGDMVDEFSAGRLRQVDSGNVPFVDQSLYQIVQGIYRKMMFQATHDPLTGTMHRHEMEKQVGRAVMQARLQGRCSALMIFDVDQFSVINTSYGTAAGDTLLKQFASLLDAWMAPVASEAMVGRLSSNEFAVLVTPCETEEALDFAERIRSRFEQTGFRHDGHQFHATLSGGVAQIDSDAEDADAAINRVSLACGAAKKAGGNRIRPYREDDRDQVRQKAVLNWVSRIDQALENNDLSLRVQRIQSLEAQDHEHYEVLLDVDGGRGEVSPQAFVEAAEKYNRASAVDRWVVERTLAWMKANPDRLGRIAMLSINLSGHSLGDDRFLAYLEGRIRQGDVPPGKLCFEVTETAAVANLHYTADFMRELRGLGCQFALDDFGTGFSSYAYLQHLPVDFLKIDGIFVKDLSENLTHYALVRSINEVAHFLGMASIAEFVDSGETMEALREIRVDFAQGYGIEKPRPLSEL